jgi:hypothetical protein
MTAILEDLDIAEVLANRLVPGEPDVNPLWTDLMAEYDAEVIESIGTGWPPVMTVPDEPEAAPAPDSTPAPGEQSPGEDSPAPEPDQQPGTPEPEPVRTEPAPGPDTADTGA